VQNEFLEQVASFLESQEVIKRILHNFEEPLLIMTNKKTEFINKQFVQTFKEEYRRIEGNILDPEAIPLNPVNHNPPSNLRVQVATVSPFQRIFCCWRNK
jgi:hypothetical protein